MTSEVGRHWFPSKALTEDGSVPSLASCLWGANFQHALLSSDGGAAEGSEWQLCADHFSSPTATATSQLDRFLFFLIVTSSDQHWTGTNLSRPSLERCSTRDTGRRRRRRRWMLGTRRTEARVHVQGLCLKAAPELFSLWVQAWRLYFDKNSQEEELLWIHHAKKQNKNPTRNSSMNKVHDSCAQNLVLLNDKENVPTNQPTNQCL